jgi:cbb3-type cytochrome oxidase maturation protein
MRMNILFILIPISLLLAFLGLCGFFWAVNNGQYEDLSSESYRVLDNNEFNNDEGEC